MENSMKTIFLLFFKAWVPVLVLTLGVAAWRRYRKYLLKKAIVPNVAVILILTLVLSFVFYGLTDPPFATEISSGGFKYLGDITFLLSILVITGIFLASFILNETRYQKNVADKINRIKELECNKRNLEQALAKEKATNASEVYQRWADNYASHELGSQKGLDGFSLHLLDIMQYQTIDGRPARDGEPKYTITELKLATNTPLLFSLQQTGTHKKYNPAKRGTGWSYEFCNPFRDYLGELTNLETFEWVYLYPTVIRSHLWWFPFRRENTEYQCWEDDHQNFLNQINLALPAILQSHSFDWARKTGMIPLVLAIITFKKAEAETTEIKKKVLVGLANLLHANGDGKNARDEAKWQKENFPWLYSTTQDIVDFFQKHYDGLGYRDMALMQAIEALLTRADASSLDVVFHQRYDKDIHGHIVNFPEHLEPDSLIYRKT